MNTRQSSSKKISKVDDSTFDSIATSTSKIALEDHRSDDEANDSVVDDKETSLLSKLDFLTQTVFQEKLEKFILQGCLKAENVSEFLCDLFSKEKSEDSEEVMEQRRIIQELYQRNRELTEKLQKVVKKNQSVEREIFHLFSRTEDLTAERQRMWDENVKIRKLSLGDTSAFLNNDSSQLNESDFRGPKYQLRCINERAYRKSFHILRVSKVLYNLIINSNVPWSTDKTYLEVLDCTSKIFDKNFDVKKKKEFKKLVDEVLTRLNDVEI